MGHWRGRDRGEAAMWPWGRDCSDVATSQWMPLTNRSCMRRSACLPLDPSEGLPPWGTMLSNVWPPELWQNKIYAILSLRVYDNLLQPPQKIHMCRIQCMNLKCTILNSFLMYCSNFFHSLSYATYCHYSLTFEPQKTAHAKALGQDRKWLVWGTGGKPVCQEPGEPHGTEWGFFLIKEFLL